MVLLKRLYLFSKNTVPFFLKAYTLLRSTIRVTRRRLDLIRH